MNGVPDSLRFNSRVLSAGAPARVGAPSYVSQLFPRRTGGYLAAWPTARGESCSFALLNAAGRLASPTRRIDGTGSSGRRCLESAAHALDGSFALDWFTTSTGPTSCCSGSERTPIPWAPAAEVVEDRNSGGFLLASAPDGRTAVTWVNYGAAPAACRPKRSVSGSSLPPACPRVPP